MGFVVGSVATLEYAERDAREFLQVNALSQLSEHTIDPVRALADILGKKDLAFDVSQGVGRSGKRGK